MNKPLILAHRGASNDAPENTLPAFRLALEQGADGLELDVHLSKDGELVVIHDETVDRTTDGSGLVQHKTLAELKTLDAGAWKDEEFAGTRIPTLEEVLEEFKDEDIIYNIEVKSGIVDYPGIEEILVEQINSYELAEQVIISSFNHYSLLHVKSLAPTIRTGILYVAGLYEAWNYARQIKADALHPAFYGVRPQLVQEAHQQGIQVNPWTVDQVKPFLQLARMGCDMIITNVPGSMKEALENGGDEAESEEAQEA